MLIWIWGPPLPTAKVEAWTQQGHRVVHHDFDEAEPDLVLITDGEDSPEQSRRLEALRLLATKSVKTKALFHAVAQPFPSDGLAQWAAWNAWPDALESDCWEIAIPALHDSEALRLEWRLREKEFLFTVLGIFQLFVRWSRFETMFATWIIL